MDREKLKELRIRIPDRAAVILDTIHKAGYEAYVVGGCVRDAIMDGSPMTGILPLPRSPDRSKRFLQGPLIPVSSTEP